MTMVVSVVVMVRTVANRPCSPPAAGCRRAARPGCDGGHTGTGAGPIRGSTPMSTTTTPVDNGVDIEFLRGARDALTAEPAGAKFKWRVTNTWVHGTHSQ